MKTEGPPHWWGQVCCVSIPPDSPLPDRRHVVAPLAQLARRSGSWSWRTCSHAYSRRKRASVQRVRQEGVCESEKFSVNLHRFACDSGAVAFAQLRPSSRWAAHTLPCGSRDGSTCWAKCSYAQTESGEETLAPVSSHPSFLLTYFSIPVPLAYLGLSGNRSHRVAQNLK